MFFACLVCAWVVDFVLCWCCIRFWFAVVVRVSDAGVFALVCVCGFVICSSFRLVVSATSGFAFLLPLALLMFVFWMLSVRFLGVYRFRLLRNGCLLLCSWLF